MNVMGEMHRRAGLFVVMLAILVYVNSLGNGFVWDDHNVILTNPALEQSALSLFGGIDTTGEFELTPYYRPLTLLAFCWRSGCTGTPHCRCMR